MKALIRKFQQGILRNGRHVWCYACHKSIGRQSIWKWKASKSWLWDDTRVCSTRMGRVCGFRRKRPGTLLTNITLHLDLAQRDNVCVSSLVIQLQWGGPIYMFHEIFRGIMIVHCIGNIVSQNVHRENWNGQLANDLRHSCVASPIFLPNWKEQNFFRQLVSSLQSTCIHSFSCSPNRWNSAKKKTQDPNICPSHRNVRGIKGSWWNRASSETGEKCRRPEIFGSWRKQEQQQSGI